MNKAKRIKDLEDRELELMRQVIDLQSEIITLKNQTLPWPDRSYPHPYTPMTPFWEIPSPTCRPEVNGFPFTQCIS